MSNEIKRPQDDSRPVGQPNREGDRERTSRAGDPDFERQRTNKPGSPDDDRLDQNTGQPGTRKPTDPNREDE